MEKMIEVDMIKPNIGEITTVRKSFFADSIIDIEEYIELKKPYTKVYVNGESFLISESYDGFLERLQQHAEHNNLGL